MAKRVTVAQIKKQFPNWSVVRNAAGQAWIYQREGVEPRFCMTLDKVLESIIKTEKPDNEVHDEH